MPHHRAAARQPPDNAAHLDHWKQTDSRCKRDSIIFDLPTRISAREPIQFLSVKRSRNTHQGLLRVLVRVKRNRVPLGPMFSLRSSLNAEYFILIGRDCSRERHVIVRVKHPQFLR